MTAIRKQCFTCQSEEEVGNCDVCRHNTCATHLTASDELAPGLVCGTRVHNALLSQAAVIAYKQGRRIPNTPQIKLCPLCVAELKKTLSAFFGGAQ